MAYPYHSEMHTLLNIVKKEYEEDLALSKQRLESLKDDPESTESEQHYFDSLTSNLMMLNAMIKWEGTSTSSVQAVVEIGYHNRLGKYISTGTHKSALREGGAKDAKE